MSNEAKRKIFDLLANNNLSPTWVGGDYIIANPPGKVPVVIQTMRQATALINREMRKKPKNNPVVPDYIEPTSIYDKHTPKSELTDLCAELAQLMGIAGDLTVLPDIMSKKDTWILFQSVGNKTRQIVSLEFKEMRAYLNGALLVARAVK